MRDFRGKTAIVTGAGSGIGRALALELADAGAKVVVTDWVQEGVEKVVEELKARGVECGGYRVDHSNLEEVKDFAEKFFTDWGHADILCCNAGVGHGAKTEETSIEDWQWVLNTNIWGPIYMIQIFVPKMIERNQGWIMITSSALGLIPAPGMIPYTTSKYAMVGLAESLKAELYKYNIKVSALCPGIINTNIVHNSRVNLLDEAGESLKQKFVEFYATRGTDPMVVARDGLRGLARDKVIITTPLHVLPMYIFHRISPSLYNRITRFVWKKGWLL